MECVWDRGTESERGGDYRTVSYWSFTDLSNRLYTCLSDGQPPLTRDANTRARKHTHTHTHELKDFAHVCLCVCVCKYTPITNTLSPVTGQFWFDTTGRLSYVHVNLSRELDKTVFVQRRLCACPHVRALTHPQQMLSGLTVIGSKRCAFGWSNENGKAYSVYFRRNS